jgi:hypothetical protein
VQPVGEEVETLADRLKRVLSLDTTPSSDTKTGQPPVSAKPQPEPIPHALEVICEDGVDYRRLDDVVADAVLQAKKALSGDGIGPIKLAELFKLQQVQRSKYLLVVSDEKLGSSRSSKQAAPHASRCAIC